MAEVSYHSTAPSDPPIKLFRCSEPLSACVQIPCLTPIEQARVDDRLPSGVAWVEDSSADWFVYPFWLDPWLEREGLLGVRRQITRLPWIRDYPDRHVFFCGDDLAVPWALPSVWIRPSCSAETVLSDPQTFAAPYGVQDFASDMHFEVDRLRFDMGFAGWIGSGAVRVPVAMALAQYQGPLRSHLRVTEQFFGYLETDERAQRRMQWIAELRDTLLVICPAGTGRNSIRLFEALSMGRVPVLLSDEVVLPMADRIPWDDYVFRVPEGLAPQLPYLIEDWVGQWGREALMERGRRCRALWEAYLSPEAWTTQLWDCLRTLKPDPSAVTVQASVFLSNLDGALARARSKGEWNLYTMLLAAHVRCVPEGPERQARRKALSEQRGRNGRWMQFQMRSLGIAVADDQRNPAG
jgi:hypothetical protein